METILACPECGSTEIIKQGLVWSGRSKLQQWRCKHCGRNTVRPLVIDKSEAEPELMAKPS